MDEQFEPQGEERVTKKIEPPCSVYDAPSIGAWLTERGRDGLRLCDWAEEDIPMPTFVEDEAQELRYWLEPAQKDAPPSVDEIARHEAMGWTYICRSAKGIFYVWRSAETTARRGRLHTDENAYAYRVIEKQLRKKSLSLVAKVAGTMAFSVFMCYLQSLKAMVWALTVDAQTWLSLVSIFLAVLSDALAGRRERQDMKRLLTSLRECEPMRSFGHGKIERRIFKCLSFVLAGLTILFLFQKYEGDSYDCADHPVPFISAEALGGTAGEKCINIRRTSLGGDITIVGEGAEEDYRRNGQWLQHSTQLEVYAPRLTFLAKPLADDVYKQYLKYCTVETLDSIDAEKAYYSHEQDSALQRLLLCDGGVILYYHTDAPEDLRQHTDELAALLRQYQS